MRFESTPRDIQFGLHGGEVRALVPNLCQPPEGGVLRGAFFRSTQPAIFPPQNPVSSPPEEVLQSLQSQGIDPGTGIFTFSPLESILRSEDYQTKKKEFARRFDTKDYKKAKIKWELVRHSRKRKNAIKRTYEEDCIELGGVWADCIFKWAWLGNVRDTNFEQELECPLRNLVYKWGLPLLWRGVECVFLRYDLNLLEVLALAHVLEGGEAVDEIIRQLNHREETIYGQWGAIKYSLLNEAQSGRGAGFPLVPKRQQTDPYPWLQGPPMLVFELEAEWGESGCPFSLDDLKDKLAGATKIQPLIFSCGDTWIEEDSLQGGGERICPKFRSGTAATILFPLDSTEQVNEVFNKAKEFLGEAVGVYKEKMPGPNKIYVDANERQIESFKAWLQGDVTSNDEDVKEIGKKVSQIEREAEERATT